MAEVNESLERPNRRRFLRQAVGAHRPVTLSCAQLYIRYVDAIGVGDAEQFVEALRRQVGAAADVLLTDREWLAREDFARAVQRALRPTVPGPSRQAGGRRTP